MKKKICRCCKKNNLLLYLDLGLQPLANSYHKGEKLSRYPLEVQLCKNCFHSQLSVVVDPDVMFKNYLYVSGTTETFRMHCKSLAEDAVKRFTTKRKLQVLDIACNDGTQLEYFRELGCSVIGVDPAENLRSITEGKKINVLVEYWTHSIAKKLNIKFDVITGTNVFAHVDDLDEFLLAAKAVLKKDGLLILEFPYADNMISHNEFDTVYHEHLSYFLVNSFKTLMDRMELHVVDVLQTKIHGGSIRFFVKSGKGKHTKKVSDLIQNEQKKGLLSEDSYRAFSQRVSKNKKDMLSLLKKLKKEKKIIGYGASAKGNTMLNFFKIHLDYIIDDNELKWGYLTPGRNIPIRQPSTLSDEKEALAIVILSWNFFNEILRKIVHLRPKSKNDTSILYVPEVKEIPVRKENIFSISA